MQPIVHCRYRAIVAYSMDSGKGQQHNIYFALNAALRNRKSDPGPFRRWRGFLYFLMRALDQLPAFSGTVFRGGNKGIDQTTVRQQYQPAGGGRSSGRATLPHPAASRPCGRS